MTSAPRLLLRLAGLGHGHRGRIALAVLAGLGTIGCGIGLAATSGYLIAKAALHPPILELSVAVVAVRAFGIGRGALRYAERLAGHELALRLLADLRVRFYQGIERLGPAGLDHHRSGELVAGVVADVDTLQNLFLRVLTPPLVALGASGLALGLSAALLPGAAAVLALVLLAAGVGVPLLAAALGRTTGRRLSQSRGALAGEVVELLQGAPDLLAYGRAADRLERVAAIDERASGLARRAAGHAGVTDGLGTVLAGLGAWLVVLIAVPAVGAGRLDGPALTVLALTALASFEAVAGLPAAFQQLGANLAAAQRLFAVADAPPAVRDPAVPLPAPAAGTVTLQGARLRYGPREPWALDGVDLRLDPGRRVAVVGPSGAGKTSLAMALLRLRELDGGRATLGGHDLRDYAAADVRRVIGLATQDVHLFNTTIRENLRLARPDASDTELEAAASRARVLEWIRGLPDGWDTTVGEQGTRVSSGQRQRLALARAVLARFPVLILDEPTANLDQATERAVMDDILAATQGTTLLLITHRLVGLERFDEILVLDRGRVVERGAPRRIAAPRRSLPADVVTAPGGCRPAACPVTLASAIPRRVAHPEGTYSPCRCRRGG